MTDAALSDANIQFSMIEAMAESLDVAVLAYDRNDELLFASRNVAHFYAVPAEMVQRGTRLRDFLGAVFDLGMRTGSNGEKNRRRANREEWIADRVSLHWRERYESVERLSRQRWISVRKRRLANGICIVALTDVSEQKKKEEQLQLDLERVEVTEAILDNLPNPVFVKDRSLSYIAANKAFCAIHGVNAEGILGRSVWDVLEPSLAEKVEASDRMVLETGKTFTLPEQIVAADGDDFWSITHKFRIGEGSRAILVTYMADVTDVVVGIGELAPDLAEAFTIRDYNVFEPAQNCFDAFRSVDVQTIAETRPLMAASERPTRNMLVVTADPVREAHLVAFLRADGADACAVHGASELTAFLAAAREAQLPLDAILVDPPHDPRPARESGIPTLVLDPTWSDAAIGTAIHALLDPAPEPSLPSLVERQVSAVATVETDPESAPSVSDWDLMTLPMLPVDRSEIDVLVAEDNDINQFVFAQILEGLGLTYRVAANGEEALQLWQTLRPRLVLMDVSMPVMNGFEATRAIRAREEVGQRTPIVAVTTQALDKDLQESVRAGMDTHIVKPVSPDMIEAVWARFQGEEATRLRQ
ncbi:response regulator [Rhizobium sp. YIM 134829]|uniref:response regulator n=1 Tax=Rhizobium sp. YIM 134829 TaxID=3390453 RepID=UPI003978C04F